MPFIESAAAAKIASAIGIRGAIAIGLAIALGLVMWRADVISGKLDGKVQELADERAEHQVTRNSVEILESELAKFIGAGEAARVAQLAAIEAQAPKSAAMRAQAAEIRSMIDQIEPGGDECRTPDFVMGN